MSRNNFALKIVALISIATIEGTLMSINRSSIKLIKTPNDSQLISPSFFHLHKYKYQKLEKISSTPPTTNCICVPYYLCDVNRTVITDGTGNIDIRYRRCTGDLEVCCNLPNANIITQMTTTQATTTTTKAPTTITTTTTAPTTMTTTTTTAPTTMTTTTTARPTNPTTIMTTPTAPTIIFPTAPITILPTGIPGINCICVYSWQCDPQNVVMIGSSGEGIIVPRQQTLLCPIAGQVCCRLSSGVIPTIITPTVQPYNNNGQICFVCGNTLQCINGANLVISSGTNLINSPQIIACPNANTCCQGTGPVTNIDTNVIVNGLGEMKFPGTTNACYCVKSWLCNQGYIINLDGAGIIDPRFTICTIADEVCCRPAGIIGLNQVYPDSQLGPRDLVVNDSVDPLAIQVVCGIRGTANAPGGILNKFMKY